MIVIPRSNSQSERQHTEGRGRSATVAAQPRFRSSAVVSSVSWDTLAAGHACPFDAPRADDTPHWNLVARLRASSWYLPHNQTYRGHGVVVFDPHHATRLDQLTSNEWQAYAVDLHRVVARDRQRLQARSHEHRVARQPDAASALARHSALQERWTVGSADLGA